MKLIATVLQSSRIGLCNRFQPSQAFRKFSAYSPFPGIRNERNSDPAESAEDFERRMFGDIPENGGNSPSFYRKLDQVQKAHNDGYGPMNNFNAGNGFAPGTNSNVEDRFDLFDDLEDNFTTTDDGMEGELKKSATDFDIDEEEVEKEDYSFRPDVDLDFGMTYDVKDLDLRRPGIQKPFKRYEFETTTEEVLQKADFRNVRFLTNFITESGIIHKRSKMKISAKAQRKLAREIKTARAFGLMPFTTMGTKQFRYGKTMEDLGEDFEFQIYQPRSFVDMEGTE